MLGGVDMGERMKNLAVERIPSSSDHSYLDWYKEATKTKSYVLLRSKKHFYDTKNWIFLRRGLNDFRDGLPPIGSRFASSEKNLDPTLHNDFVKITELKQPEDAKLMKQYQMYLSKHTPQQERRRQYIDSVQQSLLQHPLALFPHLEQSVVPERQPILKHHLKLWDKCKDPNSCKKMFEEIIDILDPYFNAPEFQEEELDLLGKLDEEGEAGISFRIGEDEKPKADQSGGSEPPRNLYRWNPQKESAKDSKKVKEKEKAWPIAQSEEEHIRQVTQEFCDWVADLGGESNNIEESTITSLFASGYDTKPALSVPIHVVDLANVPQELRLSAMVPPPFLPERQTSQEHKPKKKAKGYYEPKWVKFRYGAWYLQPNTWKKMGYLEPLEDPKQLKEHEMSEAKKKSHELNQELSTMHAATAFSEFITKKSTRKPEFLVEVAAIKKKAALEEQKRLEAELLAKQKKTASSQQKQN